MQLGESVKGLQRVAETLGSSKSPVSLLEPTIRNLTAAASQLTASAAAQTRAVKDMAALDAGARTADDGQADARATWTVPKTAVLVIALVTGAAAAVWAIFGWWN